MTQRKIKCLNCSKEIAKYDAYVDRIGQFPVLNSKAIELGREDVEICFDCFDELTDGSRYKGRSFGSGFIR